MQSYVSAPINRTAKKITKKFDKRNFLWYNTIQNSVGMGICERIPATKMDVQHGTENENLFSKGG